MDEQLKQIGERLRGLRDVLDVPVSEMAETIGISTDKYEQIEKGELDITISNLMKIARKYGVSTEALLLSLSPKPIPFIKIRILVRSLIWYWRVKWSYILLVRPLSLKRVTASISILPNLMACWLLATRPSSSSHSL